MFLPFSMPMSNIPKTVAFILMKVLDRIQVYLLNLLMRLNLFISSQVPRFWDFSFEFTQKFVYSYVFLSLYFFQWKTTGTLTVEEVYKDRDQFAALVREVAAPDVGRMGIEILSFTIKDVYDDVQYLASLGKAQTASVKRDADTGVAEANR